MWLPAFLNTPKFSFQSVFLKTVDLAVKPCACRTNKTPHPAEVMTTASVVNDLAHAGKDTWVALTTPGGRDCKMLCVRRPIPISEFRVVNKERNTHILESMQNAKELLLPLTFFSFLVVCVCVSFNLKKFPSGVDSTSCVL